MFAQILQFKPQYNYCVADLYCDRLPAVLAYNGQVTVYMYFGLVYTYRVSVKNWIKIEIILFKKLATDEEVKFNSFFWNSIFLLTGAFA